MTEKNNTTEEKGIFDFIWEFFGQLKVAIVLLIILAIVSIIGTVILQNGKQEEYLQEYGVLAYSITSKYLNWLIKIDLEKDPTEYMYRYGNTIYYWLKKLQLTNVYSSVWYKYLLFLLGLTIFVCSTNRFKYLIKRGQQTSKGIASIDKLKKFPKFFELQINKSNAETAKNNLKTVLSSFGYSAIETEVETGLAPAQLEQPQAVPILFTKGSINLWGSFLIHISLLVVFVGAVFGQYTGFKDFAVLVEGDSYLEKHYNFLVKLNNFDLELDKRYRPKDYKSDLSVFENGQEKMRKVIEVNHPLKYKGVYFYQSSYGTSLVHLRVKSPDGEEKTIDLGIDEPQQIFENLPPLYIEQNTILPDKTNPRSQLRYVVDNNLSDLGWIDKTHSIDFFGYEISLAGFTEYSGLQIKKDPGIPIVWTGFGFMIIGIYLVFFIPIRRIFGLISKTASKITIALGMAPHPSDDGGGEEFEKISEQVSNKLCFKK